MVGDVDGGEGRGCSRGSHVRAHEGEVCRVPRPLEVVGVTTEIAEGERRDVDDSHVAKAFIREQNLDSVTIIKCTIKAART